MVGNTLVKRMARFLAMPVSIWFAVWCVLAAISPAQALAQSSTQPVIKVQNSGFDEATLPDFESPIIEHIEREGGPLGSLESFGATVVDNDEIASVTLYYRFSGENEFAQLPMREIASSSFYSARVGTSNVPSGTVSIEYYIQAEDVSGNLVLNGFAFQPLVRFFEPAKPITPITPVAEPITEPVESAGGVNWLYIGLGVLAVGAIAAAAGGGGGSSGGSSDDCVGGCEVTVTFPRP